MRNRLHRPWNSLQPLLSFFGLSEISEVDKRDHERYEVPFPAQVRWKDVSGDEKEETTTIRDISFSGVLIVCRSHITKGCEVDVEIELPISEAGATKRRVSALGRVVRNVTATDPDKEGFVHGVKFDKFHFPRSL